MKARRQLTAVEKKAMINEIDRQILEREDCFYQENVASILWTLHSTFGFGKKRLKKFWDMYFQIHTEVIENYQIDETGLIYKEWLNRIGIDIEEWFKEKRV